ncbi:3322_t:CDS:2, partial [Racocetra fulgida]
MPKKASLKRNTRTSKKASASQKKFTSSKPIKSNDIHNDLDKDVENYYSKPEDSESEDSNSFNNTRISKRASANQQTFTSNKKQTFSIKHNETLNDMTKNIGSRNLEDYNNEDFDSINKSPLNNNVEDSRGNLGHDILVLDHQGAINHPGILNIHVILIHNHQYNFIHVILFLDHQDALVLDHQDALILDTFVRNILVLDHQDALVLDTFIRNVLILDYNDINVLDPGQYDGLKKSNDKESTDVLTQQ